MKIEKAYIVGTHHYCFRAGEPSEIVGVVISTPDKSEPRLAYKVLYSDGAEDFIAVSDVGVNYEIISWWDIIKSKIPKIQ